MRLSKCRHLKINSDAKSSRFVIDLKQDLTVMEARECNKALSLIAESRLEKLAELDYKRYFINGKARAMAVLKSGFNKIGQAASNLSKGSPEESILIPKPFDQALRKKGWLSVIDQ